MSDASLWIFGYGSLVWRPAFPHRRKRPARIHGYARRFWQGSTDHRGRPEQPGRVVTLVPWDEVRLHDAAADPDTEARKDSRNAALESPFVVEEPCWGMAYEIPASDPEGVLDGLDVREQGGYERFETDLFFAGDEERVRGWVYIAGTDNEAYLGPAPLRHLARQIAAASGPSGANPEYVFELERSLAEWGQHDPHVSAVANAVREVQAARASSPKAGERRGHVGGGR